MPAVGSCCACRINRRIPIKIFAVDAVIGVVLNLGAISEGFGGPFFGSGFCGYQASLGGFCGLGNNVNHAVDSVSAPQGGSGATNDFDAVHVFEHDVLHVPVDTGEKRGIDAAAVDQNEQLVIESPVESSRADGPLILV